MTVSTIEASVEHEEQTTHRPVASKPLRFQSHRSAAHTSNGSNGAGKHKPFVLPHGDNLPDHTQLPDSDGAIVNNFVEPPQSILLTSSLEPVLDHLHPDKQYLVGQDSGIYWDLKEPLLDGARAPDWFYVPNRPQMLDGKARGSYVLWKEETRPMLVIEYVSDDERKEWDQTPETGKFWIYENAICAQYYAIYDPKGNGSVELYTLHNGHYVCVEANQRNHYPIPEMGIELGLRWATYRRMEMPWLRAWDLEGNLILESDERAEQERQARCEAEAKAGAALSELEQLKTRLQAMGIDPASLLGK